MSGDNNSNANNNRDNELSNVIPYETLKAGLDQAKANMEAASAAFLAAVQRQDPPLFIKLALHNFDEAYAAATARTNAIVSEYGHLVEVTQNIQSQRDETNRKYEAMKKTVRQLKHLDLDEDEGNNEKPKGKRGKK